jgi:ABC-type antimicrobial peptide transport system permease subunit
VIVRSNGAPEALASSVRRTVLDEDRSASVTLTPMRQAIAFAVLPSKMGSICLGLLAGLGVVLAMVGLFGVVSFSVSRRAPEIAIRMALGASSRAVLALVLTNAGGLVLTGLGAGLALAWLVTAPLSAFLVAGIGPRDTWSFSGAAVLLLASAFAAIWGPATRAIRVAPAAALKID